MEDMVTVIILTLIANSVAIYLVARGAHTARRRIRLSVESVDKKHRRDCGYRMNTQLIETRDIVFAVTDLLKVEVVLPMYSNIKTVELVPKEDIEDETTETDS